MKIYVASSWRNKGQPFVVNELRRQGHRVYDFRNPPNRSGFGWEKLDPDWQNWDVQRYKEMLDHPIAIRGFNADMEALDEAHACVLVMPCGRSAHLEAGYAIGQNKPTAILFPSTVMLLGDGTVPKIEPELMYRMADLVTDYLAEVFDWLESLTCSGRVKP